MSEVLIQLALFVFSASAIWLLSNQGASQRWGWVLGLASQPFWLYSTAAAGQWGMFALSAFYTWIWARGLRNHWREV